MELAALWDAQLEGSSKEESHVDSLRDLLVRRNTPYLADLLNQRENGWRLKALDAKFAEQRQNADQADFNTRIFFTKSMTVVLGDIDIKYGIVNPKMRQFEFLDIGSNVYFENRCASGGFTAYVLSANPAARGVGVTLPTEEGGHPWMLSSDIDNRFQLIWHNLLSYDLGPASRRTLLGHDPFPFFSRTFNLILLDGHRLRTQVETEFARGSEHERLLLGQFQIGLRCVMDGGTIVMKLSKVEDELTARVLVMLDKIANELYVHKPTSTHRNRASCYAIAKGVRCNETLNGYVAALQELWYEMTYGGREGRGTSIPQEQILEGLVPFDELTEETNLDRLTALGTGAWKIQLDALRMQHQKYEHSRRPPGVPGIRGQRPERSHA